MPSPEAVDAYLEALLVPADAALDAALSDAARAGLPPADVSPTQGRLLQLLAQLCGARRILELGTLAGYSTIWLARALPPDGSLVSLELDPAYAAVARANLARAGVGERVAVREGPARETLAQLVAEGAGPFDLIFIDADKRSNAAYLELALQLSRPGTLIVADNVVRGGAVADPATADESVRGVRAFLDLVAADPRLHATAIQTVGRKGHDGFALVRVDRV